MGTRQIEEGIKALEKEIAYRKAAAPAHDHTGEYERKVFELEEKLAEKREALAEMIQKE